MLSLLSLTLSLTIPLQAAAEETLESADRNAYGPLNAPSLHKIGPLIDVFATAFVGDGLRFNNPYRLASILGRTAHSLSRTARYADVGVAVALADPANTANGIALRASAALEGVAQAVLTPSYLLIRRSGAWAAYARTGIAVVISPDTTWGVEGAAGGVWFARAGIGVAAELVGDIFYGAGTREVAQPLYPVLSAQGGLWLSWQALL